MSVEIPLTKGQKTIVDDGDYFELSQWKWHCSITTNGYKYAARSVSYYENGKRRTKKVWLGKWLLKAPSGMVVDYINGDTLDNRRENIRLATIQQDSQNAHVKPGRYKGASAHQGKWRGSIHVNGATIQLGMFNTREEAAKAYDVAARQYFGEFAKLNFPIS